MQTSFDQPYAIRCKIRIEWKDFFNHMLFELHSKNKYDNFGNINNSMMYKNHEDTVKQEFTKNKEVTVDTKLIDPVALETNNNVKKKATEEETFRPTRSNGRNRQIRKV